MSHIQPQTEPATGVWRAPKIESPFCWGEDNEDSGTDPRSAEPGIDCAHRALARCRLPVRRRGSRSGPASSRPRPSPGVARPDGNHVNRVDRPIPDALSSWLDGTAGPATRLGLAAARRRHPCLARIAVVGQSVVPGSVYRPLCVCVDVAARRLGGSSPEDQSSARCRRARAQASRPSWAVRGG